LVLEPALVLVLVTTVVAGVLVALAAGALVAVASPQAFKSSTPNSNARSELPHLNRDSDILKTPYISLDLRWLQFFFRLSLWTIFKPDSRSNLADFIAHSESPVFNFIFDWIAGLYGDNDCT
jgi:hypothetical protein